MCINHRNTEKLEINAKKFTRRAAAKRLQTKCRALKGGSLHDFIRKLILIRHTPQYHSFTVNRIFKNVASFSVIRKPVTETRKGATVTCGFSVKERR